MLLGVIRVQYPIDHGRHHKGPGNRLAVHGLEYQVGIKLVLQVNRRPLHQPRMQHKTRSMGQGTHQQQFLVFRDLRMNHVGQAVDHHRPMRVQHSLGASRGATGVHDERGVFRLYRQPLESLPVALEQFRPVAVSVVDAGTRVVQLINMPKSGLSQRVLVELINKGTVHHQHLGAGMPDHVTDVVRTQHFVKRHLDRAQLDDREVGDDKLDAIAQQDSQAVTFADANAV